MTPELVIFDMDGVLFDTEKIYYKAWVEAASSLGYTFTWEIYTQIIARNSEYIGRVLKQIFGASLPYDALLKQKRALSDQMVKEQGLELKRGVYELLEHLELKGIKKALATSSNRQKVLGYLEVASLENRFDYIICGNDVVESKPNPEIFLKAAAALTCSPSNCMVLEDSRFGIQAAKAAGMMPVFIPDLVQADEEIKQNLYRECESLLNVMDLLKD